MKASCTFVSVFLATPPQLCCAFQCVLSRRQVDLQISSHFTFQAVPMAEVAPSPRRVTSWHLSRFAPSPSLAEIQMREKRFVLDCVAVERISKDYSVSLPKLGSVIPPYNSQKDYHVRGYFLARPVPPVLKKTGQVSKGFHASFLNLLEV